MIRGRLVVIDGFRRRQNGARGHDCSIVISLRGEDPRAPRRRWNAGSGRAVFARWPVGIARCQPDESCGYSCGRSRRAGGARRPTLHL